MSHTDREFAATAYSETLFENANRMLNTIAPLTVTAYEKRWRAFVNAQHEQMGIKNKLEAIVDELIQKAISHELSWSSVRLYKATICYGITMTYLAKFHGTKPVYSDLKIIANFKPERGLTFDNTLDKAFFEALYCKIKDFTIPKEDKGKSKNTGKTSSTKDKGLDDNIYDILLNKTSYSSANFSLLKEFIKLNCILGLRPIEWHSIEAMTRLDFESNYDRWFEKMTKNDVEVLSNKRQRLNSKDIYSGLIEVGDSASVIVVKNGKNSQGRAGIEYRALYVKDEEFYKKVLQMKADLLIAAQGIADLKSSEGDSSFFDATGMANIIAFDNLMSTLQKTMRRAIDADQDIQKILRRKHRQLISNKNYVRKSQGLEPLEQEPPMKVPTIYSTRHQAVADAKQSGMSPIAMAAMFGHSSIVTARRHYGKSAMGSGRTMVRPSNANIDNVILGMTEQQLEAYNENRIESLKRATQEVSNSRDDDMTPGII